MRMQFLLLTLTFFAASLSGPSRARADDFSSLSFGGEGELYVPVPLESATADGDRLRVRSVEVTTQSDFDDWFPGLDAKLTLGAEDDNGDLIFNVREGFLNVTDLGFKGFDLRAGKFYLPIGVLNQQRKSAWSFESAPQALQLFFTDKGIDDSGVDLSYHSGHFQVHAGVTNGFRFDSSVSNNGTRPETPTHYFRPEVRAVWAEATLVVGGDYVARVDDQGETTRISGLDLNFQSSDDTLTAWQAQAEGYHRYQNPNNELGLSEDIGGYVYGERGLGRKFIAGLRLRLLHDLFAHRLIRQSPKKLELRVLAGHHVPRSRSPPLSSRIHVSPGIPRWKLIAL